jgi:cob(I)alamin adenosyltransferase
MTPAKNKSIQFKSTAKKKISAGNKVRPLPAVTARGLVIVITGNGKGKTTSAFGQALRAVGQGYKVLIVQFMKGRKYGEFIAAEKYLPRLTIHRFGLDSFVMRDNPAAVDIELAKQGFEFAEKAIASGKYNMVILDEINVAVDFKLIDLKQVVEMIKNKPPALDLILTGRYAAKEIIKLADTVSEVKEIKHHYAAGIKDRAGIEY